MSTPYVAALALAAISATYWFCLRLGVAGCRCTGGVTVRVPARSAADRAPGRRGTIDASPAATT